VARPRFDFTDMLAAFRAGDWKMDPSASGLYWRYQLQVQYLLETKKTDLDALFRKFYSLPELEKELRSLPKP
jgi:hypothetical protein